MRKNKGITLIALVITIIILIILAGVSINLILGQDGIINKTKQGSETYKEEQAKERLELELANLTMEKVNNKDYNQNEYLTNRLTQKGFIVNENIVTVDGWKFEIDRSVPKVIGKLGKGEENKEIQILATVTNNSNYTKATIKIEITYEKVISSILVNNNEIELPEKIDGKYIAEITVENNGQYKIIVKDEEGQYKTAEAKVTEISEDMEVTSVEQLMLLAERVNNGATYEGKTITLSKDINLNENKYTVNADGSITFHSDAEQWIPIGTEDNPFRGTFDGQGHTIKGIYINDETKDTQGFIGQNTRGTIKNLTLDEGYIVAGYRVGGVTGRSSYGEIDNVINKMNIESKATNEYNGSIVGGISGSGVATIRNCTNYGNITGVGSQVGGIIGYIEGSTSNIENCANLSDYVKTTGASPAGYTYAGGLVGYSVNSNITKCYNTADITGAKANVGGIVGVSTGTITKCYNTGNIKSLGVNELGNNTMGGIVGFAGNTVSDCYNIGTVTGTAKMIGGIVGSNGETESTVKQELSNCYNVGIIKPTTATYRGGVIGAGKSTSNSYYLTGQASYGVGGSTSTTGSNTNATSKTKAQLQALASTLGTNWISDGKIQNENGEWVNNVDSQGNIIYINGGYPILKWQMEK